MPPSAPNASQPGKGKIIGKAIISGAAKVVPIRRARGVAPPTGPQPGEQPAATLRVRIIGCNDLLAKDKNGKSDPFVGASLLRKQFHTPSIKSTLDPEYSAKDATFDFPIYLSLAEVMGPLELIVWDKDFMKKEYLGEVAIPCSEWFPAGQPLLFEDQANEPFTLPLLSTRSSTPATGVIRLKLGLVAASMPDVLGAFDEIVKRSQRANVTLTSAPPTQGVGTVRSDNGHEPVDDGIYTDEETDEDYDHEPPPPSQVIAGNAPVAVTAEKTKTSPKFLPSFFSSGKRPEVVRRPSLTPFFLEAAPDALAPPVTDGTAAGVRPAHSSRSASISSQSSKRPKFKRSVGKNSSFNFAAQRDVLGIVMIEVQGAEDLPKLPNMTRLGWDMDPFVVISFGKKVFRTRVIRHSLNPTWDEKLLFHVRRYESVFNVQFSVLDWDKLSGNDMVAEAHINLEQLMKDAPKPDPETGLYPQTTDDVLPMQTYKLPLAPNKEVKWDSKHSPQITFRAKYQPYDMLRQRFWAQYLRQYDTDETGSISHLEITSMLDSLGSTLSRETVNSFFTRHGKAPERDEISIPEAIRALEDEIHRPDDQRKRLSDSVQGIITAAGSAVATPSYDPGKEKAGLTGQLSFAGPNAGISSSPEDEVDRKLAAADRSADRNHGLDTHPGEVSGNTRVLGSLPYPAGAAPASVQKGLISDPDGSAGRHSPPESSTSDEESGSLTDDSGVERVINVKTCPLCHRPRLNSKAETDIITHLAVCASQDWARVDRITVGNFVTANQAQRKWYTKVISKVSSGAYSIGANSANIIVQNRMTGQLEEEKMQVYVRLGIRLLYKGAKSQMEGQRARGLLKSMSIKQGVKYDDPASAAEIPSFIEFHNLNVNEIRDPLNSFKTFNEFFYRKLREDARPVEEPNNPKRIVSAADCRLMAFETITEATKLWIKGREFSVARLLGEKYKDEIADYNGGALVIFRLAPQDYHRYHSPVDGTVGPISTISGEYYTVNPQAIRTTLDVYGENVRKIVPIDSPTFGRVFNVCIGAMMVGSICMTVKEGDKIARGQEYGYFAFGGSTIVTVFKKGAVTWDEDLLINGRASLETLVRVGMGLGRKQE